MSDTLHALETNVADGPTARSAAVVVRSVPRLGRCRSSADAARLFRAGKAPVVILSGGRNPARPESLSEAESGALLLGDLGLPREALIVESQARTTRDNVIRISDIIHQRRIGSFLLVTSARHMTRSVAAFRAEGLEPISVPTDFTVVRDPAFSIRHYLPSASALARSSKAVHEIAGFWFYRVMGWV